MGNEHQSLSAALQALSKSAAEAGFQKQAAGLLDKAMSGALRPSGILWPIIAGGGLGALMGPEDRRAESAIAGIIGGAIGRQLLRPTGRRLGGYLLSAAPQEQKIIREGGAALKRLRDADMTLDTALNNAEMLTGEGGRALGALGGGYALRAKQEHDFRQGLQEPQPVMYDMGGKYTGFLPDELNDAGLLGL